MEKNDSQSCNIEYEKILEHYEIEDVQERFGVWYSDAKKFIEKKGLADFARINTRRLGYAVCDYFADMIRMKEFHGIGHANLNKIYAYSCYWFLRRQPIQLISNVEKNADLYINELFIVNNLLAKLKQHCSHNEIIQKTTLLEMANLWFYNFKFRIFTAQSLELAICSFFTANGNRSTVKNDQSKGIF